MENDLQNLRKSLRNSKFSSRYTLINVAKNGTLTNYASVFRHSITHKAARKYHTFQNMYAIIILIER